mmetsp:Transcript_44404/g.105187  ORF Transcript_44404/g.105187 Transcript_44404/m.105187 type:complete len:332 (-) Transcript_44404:1333-2328(-)
MRVVTVATLWWATLRVVAVTTLRWATLLVVVAVIALWWTTLLLVAAVTTLWWTTLLLVAAVIVWWRTTLLLMATVTVWWWTTLLLMAAVMVWWRTTLLVTAISILLLTALLLQLPLLLQRHTVTIRTLCWATLVAVAIPTLWRTVTISTMLLRTALGWSVEVHDCTQHALFMNAVQVLSIFLVAGEELATTLCLKVAWCRRLWSRGWTISRRIVRVVIILIVILVLLICCDLRPFWYQMARAISTMLLLPRLTCSRIPFQLVASFIRGLATVAAMTHGSLRSERPGTALRFASAPEPWLLWRRTRCRLRKVDRHTLSHYGLNSCRCSFSLV